LITVYNLDNQANREVTKKSLSVVQDNLYHHKLADKMPDKQDKLSNDIPFKTYNIH